MFAPNETTKLFDDLGTFFYLCGLPGFWVKEVPFPKKFVKIYDKITYFIHIFLILFSCSAVGSLFTQNNLTEKQEYDRSFLAYVVPFLMMIYIPLFYYKAKVRDILYRLAVVLKELYNDPHLEEEMTRKIRVFSTVFFFLSLLVVGANGLMAIIKVITAGAIFCPVIPTWPHVNDNSAVSVVMRTSLYVGWWLYDIRAMATFILLVTMMVVICYQFKNLQTYFYGLDDIFLDEGLSHIEKEIKYEKALKRGIHMHAVTLWCRTQHQDVCKWIFASEIVMCVVTLMSYLNSLMSGNRDITTLTAMIPMIIFTLLTLALFMWNGGDITIEASKVSEAMYNSGWENCRGQSSARVRKLVANAIRQAQEPVVYKTLGVVEFSYESYVKISKLPYTVVSMFY